MAAMSRLSDYPFVIVRIACTRCSRRGQYRLARLAERFGADAELTSVLSKLAAGCIYAGIKRHKGSYGTCGVMLPDLTDPPPAAPGLRVVGGQR